MTQNREEVLQSIEDLQMEIYGEVILPVVKKSEEV
jgi:hypothetical protein